MHIEAETWSREDEAHRLHVSITTLDKLIRQHQPPVLRAGNRILFDRVAHEYLSAQIPQAKAGPLLSASEIVGAAHPWKSLGCGVYFLLFRKKIIYVGRGTEVSVRLAAHTRDKKFDAWFFISCEEHELEVTERAYLDALDPPLNHDHTTCMRRRRRNNE
jgi:hypothetical protein